MSKYARPAHKRAAKMLGYALTLDSFDGWETASAIWQARLTATERAALAWAALRALDDDQAETVAETVLGGAGAPLPPFLDALPDARLWASMATRNELKAHALAAFEAMGAHDRRDFAAFVARGGGMMADVRRFALLAPGWAFGMRGSLPHETRTWRPWGR